ncbi:MAG: type II toxin-antitoxin system VapC family toxin [Dehalococcoidia bacterium]|nr:type II toxin-antitoxin system VapC family toxin [Dehalococcoidia bacterium]
MSGYLLDTNVVSENVRRNPSPAVVDFLAASDDLWLSAIVVGELELGIQLLPEGQRSNELRSWLSMLLEEFGERVLPVRNEEAQWAATFQARRHRTGGELALADALIAGTAKANDLFVLTRNVRDFANLDLEVVNPWEPNGRG